jgi:NAD-dependent dihydropyrimidine dehydrogenase PreA subunit
MSPLSANYLSAGLILAILALMVFKPRSARFVLFTHYVYKYAGRWPMAYVINEPCIGTKDNSCVEVCPVDCIHPTPDEPGYDAAEQLYIDPDECIDCDACVEVCPVDAITPEDQVPPEWQKYVEINAAYFSNRA